jgi:putative ABC transport system permease protein
MQFSENLSQAVRNVRANSSGDSHLAHHCIWHHGVGGHPDSIDALLFTMNDNFSAWEPILLNPAGSSSNLHSNRRGREEKRADPIDFRRQWNLKSGMPFLLPGVCISGFGKWGATIKYGKEKTNPTVLIFGVDEEFMSVRGYDLAAGRDFTNVEQEGGVQVAMIGMDIVNDLFNKQPEKALNKDILIDNQRFLVVGVLASKVLL